MTRPYPKLMQMISQRDGSLLECIVFFETPERGMVLHSEGEDLPRFGHIDRWSPELFVDVGDDVVVWITEGPQEPIYEAIEILEKIKSLKEASKD